MSKDYDEFKKLFPEGKEGLGGILDGYFYIRYSRLYIYYLKKVVNMFKKEKDTLIYPEDIAHPDIDEMVRTTTERLLPKLLKHETNTYHGKIVKIEDARKLLTLNVEVNMPSLPETIIPYEKARDLIIQNPDQLCVIDCPCRTTKENPCYPLDVCIIVGEPFVSVVLEKNQDNPRKITQDEALEILKNEHNKGHVHTAYFKDSMADRFYCICNCCKCCCTAMNAHFGRTPMLAHSGYMCHVSDECQACGNCADYCQFGAITIEEKAVVDYTVCMGCGICEDKCINGAIELKRHNEKGEPLDVEELLAQEIK